MQVNFIKKNQVIKSNVLTEIKVTEITKIILYPCSDIVSAGNNGIELNEGNGILLCIFLSRYINWLKQYPIRLT